MDLSDLPALLKLYRDRFEADLAPDYEWVNNIKEVKKHAPIIAKLDEMLVDKLNSEDHGRVWLSIPEVIDWKMVVGFMFTHGRRRRYPDINLQGFLDSIEKGEEITLQLLQARSVMCADEDNKPLRHKWSVYKCIYAEIDYDSKKYVLNGGTWFQVSANFVAATNEKFNAAAYSTLKLPKYTGGGEGTYNQQVASKAPAIFALLDNDWILHGGAQGKVEICDLFSTNKELIHVKVYGRSSVLSHLFAQGFVSGQLIQLDSEFRKKVKAKLKGAFSEVISVPVRPADKEFTIVFAVISNKVGNKLDLPFFSRVNFNNTARVLEGFGYRVQLLKIDWEEAFSKTTIGPPVKPKKL